MNTEVLDRTENQVDVVLSQRVSDIRDDLDGIKKNAIDSLRRAIRVGENLVIAKEEVLHGQWTQWLQDNFEMSVSTARRYMSLYEKMKTRDVACFEKYSLSQIYELIPLGEDMDDFISKQEEKGTPVEKQKVSKIRQAKKEYKGIKTSTGKGAKKPDVKVLEGRIAELENKVNELQRIVDSHCTGLSRLQVLQRELVFRYAIREMCDKYYDNVSKRENTKIKVIGLGLEFWEQAPAWEKREINELCGTHKQ